MVHGTDLLTAAAIRIFKYTDVSEILVYYLSSSPFPQGLPWSGLHIDIL
jgi:hypothetical protein